MKIKAIIALWWVGMVVFMPSCFEGAQTKAADVLDTSEISTPTQENPKPTLTETLSTFSPTPIATLHPRQQSIQEMVAVVDVIKAYYEDYGVYPGSIDDLIPIYLTESPITNEGFEIMYAIEDSIFLVWFEPNPRKYCSYLSSEDSWECGFNSLEH